MVRNWVISFLGNFIGAILFVFLNYIAEIFSDEDSQAHAAAIAISIAKSQYDHFTRTLIRAILCNWLVCIAVWQATAAQEIVGKIFGIFWPILAFVAIG